MANSNWNYLTGSIRLVRLKLISNLHLGCERCRFPKELGVMLPEQGGKMCWAIRTAGAKGEVRVTEDLLCP